MDLQTLMQSSGSRVAEEQLYEIIAEEIEVKNMRKGLWMKAFAQAKGDETLAQATYIDLRLQSLKDELVIYTKELAHSSSKNVQIDKETKVLEYQSAFKQKKVVVTSLESNGYAVHLPDRTSVHARTFEEVLKLVEKIPNRNIE